MMKHNLWTNIALVTITGISLGACGGGSSDSASDDIATTTDIVVERGPLLGAAVLDSKGVHAGQVGPGVYRFTASPTYPITTAGGFIDLNRNGVVDTADIKVGELVLKSGSTGNVVTLASTLASNAATKTRLLELGFTESQLFDATPTQDRMIAALSDAAFQYAMENGLKDMSSLTEAQATALVAAIQARLALYQDSTKSSAELEQELVTTLAPFVQPVDPTEASTLASADGNQLLIASLPVYTLTDAQKEMIAYMWNEEKLAKDVYLALNAIYPSNQLNNIANNSEAQHQAAMASLLEKYNLDVWQPWNEKVGYSASNLSLIQPGEFTLTDLQTLYDNLLLKGSASAQASLEVGCMVEVTDVNDLDHHLEQVGNLQDVKSIFESLRSGSYNHYWAFDNGLKSLGVAEGCCSLGAEYCHPEYPVVQRGQGRGFGKR